MSIEADTASSFFGSTTTDEASVVYTIATQPMLVCGVNYTSLESSALATNTVRWGTSDGGSTFTLSARSKNDLGLSSQITSEIWTLRSPAPGTTTVHVKWNSSAHSRAPRCFAMSVRNTSGVGASTGATGASSTPSVALTLGEARSWLLAGWASCSGVPLSTVSGETLLANTTGAPIAAGIGNISPATSGAETFNMIGGIGAVPWSMAAIELLAVLDPSPRQWRHAHGVGSVTP